MNTRPIFEPYSESLSHYGVQGMKWGVRNPETLRKYAHGGLKRTKQVNTDIRNVNEDSRNISLNKKLAKAYRETAKDYDAKAAKVEGSKVFGKTRAKYNRMLAKSERANAEDLEYNNEILQKHVDTALNRLAENGMTISKAKKQYRYDIDSIQSGFTYSANHYSVKK